MLRCRFYTHWHRRLDSEHLLLHRTLFLRWHLRLPRNLRYAHPRPHLSIKLPKYPYPLGVRHRLMYFESIGVGTVSPYTLDSLFAWN